MLRDPYAQIKIGRFFVPAWCHTQDGCEGRLLTTWEHATEQTEAQEPEPLVMYRYAVGLTFNLEFGVHDYSVESSLSDA